MASGVQVADACLTTFRELKLGKKYKYIIFNISKDLKEIIVEKKSEESNYDKFLGELPADECRWAVYDVEFEKDGGKRNKLCFISWSPEGSKIKDRMLFASSRNAIRQRLDGIAVEIQGTESSEVELKTILDKAQLSSR